MSSETATSFIYVVHTVHNVISNSHHDSVSDERFSWPFTGHITIALRMQAAYLVCGKRIWLMQARTHWNIVERLYFMHAWRVRGIFPEKPFHPYITNLSSKETALPKLLIVGSVSNTSAFPVHHCKNKLERVKDDPALSSTKLEKIQTDKNEGRNRSKEATSAWWSNK